MAVPDRYFEEPHVCIWEPARIAGTYPAGTAAYKCQICGTVAFSDGSMGRVTDAAIRELTRDREKEGTVTKVADHGGIAGYDPATRTVITADGSMFSDSALLAANPTVNYDAMMRALREISSGAVATKAAFNELKVTSSRVFSAMQEPGQAVSETPRWNAEDALTLILETIKHSDDPNATAGEWLTKITNGIIEITRDIDE